ncbi:MAG: hypothetical protein ACYDER_29805 [Ktedonobacteraceae bacterium]
MFYEENTASGADHPLVIYAPSRRTPIHHTTRQWLVSLFLSLLLCANVIGSWAFSPTIALAAAHPHALPAHLTLQQYLQQGRPDHVYHGPLIRPQSAPPVPVKTQGKPINYAKCFQINLAGK